MLISRNVLIMRRKTLEYHYIVFITFIRCSGLKKWYSHEVLDGENIMIPWETNKRLISYESYIDLKPIYVSQLSAFYISA